MMFNWIARNSKETESEQVTTILSVAYVIYAIQLNSQYHNSIEYKFSEPNFFLMLYVFVRPGLDLIFTITIYLPKHKMERLKLFWRLLLIL